MEAEVGVQPTVEFRGVSKRYGDEIAVDHLDLSIPPGSTYGLLGPNGSGKTTTIRMLLRILEPDTGSVAVFGRPLERRALDRIGYLPEERGVYKKMKVRAFLTFLGELKGVRAAESAPRIAEWLERLDLADRSDSRLEELSKGMQQKIQFIGAILHEPELVILDEPFSGLDPINQQVLKEIIVELKTAKRTILFSTHILSNAERTCDHVCILADGRKLVDGDINTVKSEHGGSHLRLTVERWTPDTAAALRALPGVHTVREHGADAELSLADDTDPQALLATLVDKGIRLQKFERVQPSLEQIFVDRVSAPRDVGEAAEVARG